MGDRSRLVKVSWPDHHQELVNGLWNFVSTKHLLDFNFEWSGKPVRAHQLVLDVFLSSDKVQGSRAVLGGDVKRRNLDSLLEFLYRGEATIRQEELDNVCEMAKTLGFKMLVAAVQSTRGGGQNPTGAPVGASRRGRKRKEPAPLSDPQDSATEKCATNDPPEASIGDWQGIIEAMQSDLQPPGRTLSSKPTYAEWDEESSSSDADGDTSSTYGEASTRRQSRGRGRAKTKQVDSRKESKISVAQRSRLYRQKLPLVKCGLCEYQTREKRYYGTHMNKYHPGVPIPTCTLCKQVFFDQESLGRHMSKMHSIDDLEVTISVSSGANSETAIVGVDVAAKTTNVQDAAEATPVEELRSEQVEKSATKPAIKSGLSAAERKKIYLANRPQVKCPHCDYKTAEKRYYAAHMGRKHPEVAVPTCDLCRQTFFDEESLAKHKATPNLMVHSDVYVRPMNMANARLAEKRKEAVATGDQTKTRGKTERDRWSRANRPSLHCNLCDYTTNDKRYLSNHMIVQHPGYVVTRCETCQYAFPDDKALAAHRRKYAGGECGAVHNKCPLCAYETPMKYKMYSHLYARHGVNAKGEPVVHRHKCTECDYAGLLPSHLKRHVLVKHSGLKPYNCPRCSYAANNKTAVTTHLRKFHLKLKPWLCDTCGHRCSSKHDLQRHHRVHTGERPYPCSQCGLAFADSYTLNGHIRSKHCDAKPFVCQVCAHAFKRLDNLRSHLKKVHQTV